MDYRWIKTVETDEKRRPTQTGGINGGLMKRPAGYEGRAWVNYVSVESLDQSVERAQKLGARVMKGRSAVPGMGWFAMLIDPQGNPFALWEADSNAK
jgi:predicted enzyme related to lactoylglutathione lyase